MHLPTMDTIGRPDDTWQSEASTQHLKTATREFWLRDVHVIDGDDPDLGFVGTLPSGNLLELKSAISSGAVQAPPEVQIKTHRPLRVSFDAFMSTSIETMKGTIRVAERKLQHLVHEHLSQEKQAWRDDRIAFMRDVEQEASELFERVVSSATFKQHDGIIMTDAANPIVIFAYAYDDDDELEMLMRLLEVEFTRHLKGLDHLTQFLYEKVRIQIERHGRDRRCFVMLDTDTAELENHQLRNSFMSRTHEELRKKIIAAAERAAAERAAAREGIKEGAGQPSILAMIKQKVQKVVDEVDGELVQRISVILPPKIKKGAPPAPYTVTVFLNTDDPDEARLFVKVLEPLARKELKVTLFKPFGFDRPKMGFGITLQIPRQSLAEGYGDNSRQLQFAKLYRELMRLKQEDGLPYLRAFPYQQCFVLGLDRDADEDEKQLVLKLVTNMAARALSIGHTVKMSSWDNGPAVAVYPANYAGLSKDMKQAVTSVVTEAVTDDISMRYFKAVEAIREKLVQTALEFGNTPIIVFLPARGGLDDVWLSIDGGLNDFDEEAVLFKLLAQQAQQLVANSSLVDIVEVDPPVQRSSNSYRAGHIRFHAKKRPGDRNLDDFADWHLSRKAQLRETFGNAEPAFKTPAQIALDKESKRKVTAFETAIRHEILWINVALRSIDPPAGLFEFDRGFHLEPKGIMFTLNCRHPVQEEHELWLKLAKLALEKPRDEGVVVTIEPSHGNEEQWVADWAKWPEVDTPDWVHHICITINDEELHEVCSWMTNKFRSDFVLREFDPRWREDSFDDHAQDLTKV